MSVRCVGVPAPRITLCEQHHAMRTCHPPLWLAGSRLAMALATLALARAPACLAVQLTQRATARCVYLCVRACGARAEQWVLTMGRPCLRAQMVGALAAALGSAPVPIAPIGGNEGVAVAGDGAAVFGAGGPSPITSSVPPHMLLPMLFRQFPGGAGGGAGSDVLGVGGGAGVPPAAGDATGSPVTQAQALYACQMGVSCAGSAVRELVC